MKRFIEYIRRSSYTRALLAEKKNYTKKVSERNIFNYVKIHVSTICIQNFRNKMRGVFTSAPEEEEEEKYVLCSAFLRLGLSLSLSFSLSLTVSLSLPQERERMRVLNLCARIIWIVDIRPYCQ